MFHIWCGFQVSESGCEFKASKLFCNSYQQQNNQAPNATICSAANVGWKTTSTIMFSSVQTVVSLLDNWAQVQQLEAGIDFKVTVAFCWWLVLHTSLLVACFHCSWSNCVLRTPPKQKHSTQLCRFSFVVCQWFQSDQRQRRMKQDAIVIWTNRASQSIGVLPKLRLATVHVAWLRSNLKTWERKRQHVDRH